MRLKGLVVSIILVLGLTSLAFARTVREINKTLNPIIEGKRIGWWQLSAEQIAKANLDLAAIKNELQGIANDSKNSKEEQAYALAVEGNVCRIPLALNNKKAEAKKLYLQALEIDPKCSIAGWELPSQYDVKSKADLAELEKIFQKTGNLWLLKRLYSEGWYKGNHQKSLEYLRSVTRQDYNVKIIEVCLESLDKDFLKNPEYLKLLKELYSVLPKIPANADILGRIKSELVE